MKPKKESTAGTPVVPATARTRHGIKALKPGTVITTRETARIRIGDVRELIVTTAVAWRRCFNGTAPAVADKQLQGYTSGRGAVSRHPPTDAVARDGCGCTSWRWGEYGRGGCCRSASWRGGGRSRTTCEADRGVVVRIAKALVFIPASAIDSSRKPAVGCAIVAAAIIDKRIA